MAKDIKLIIGGDARGAEAAIASLQRNGTQAASLLEREFSQLGIKSALSFDNQRKAATTAYDKIKSSGLATNQELERSQKAHTAAMTRIDEAEHGKRLGMIDKFKANWLGATAAIAAGWALASKAITLAQDGAAFIQQGISFANLAAASGVSADKMVADLRRISGETVSTQQLIEKAGTAMLLGVETQAIPKLMEIAKASSRITGQTVTEAFGDLSLAVARQSKMILDNLGILVDVEKTNIAYAASLGKTAEQLTDTERRQAFLNATLEKGQDIIEKVGKQAASDADKFATFSASIDNIGKSVGILLSGPMAHLAEEMSSSVGWFEAYRSGQISFWEYATTGAETAAKRLKDLRVTNLDASLTPEGIALARRKIEEKGRALAEADAIATKEAKKVAAENRVKELTEIDAHNTKIIAIDKKRIDLLKEQETAHLKTLTDDYGAAVSKLDALIDARSAARKNSAARNSVTVAPFGEDEFGAAIRAWDDLGKAAEAAQKIWDPIEQAKAQEAIITQAQALASKQVEIDGAVLLSKEESANRAATIIQTQEAKIKASLDAEIDGQTRAAESTAEAMNRKQLEVDTYISKLQNLETLLDRMNHKEVNIIFKATGADQLLQAGGITGLNTSSITDPIMGASFHGGTGYVGKSGLYPLARGESVSNRNETASRSSGNVVTIAPVIHINGTTAQGRDKTARELAREIEPELRKIAGRYRG